MNIPELLTQLTVEEKAALVTGGDSWHTQAVERLGIPAIMVSDGPHGLRTMLPDNTAVKSVCFPAGCATGCSFDRDLLEQEGTALGEEARSFGVNVILGPGATLKRSPLCGRNFEYFSEDPYLSGETAAAVIRGIQSQGVGTSLKHFFANNQEDRRMSVSANMDERTMREIYLANFEYAVKGGRPWTVMDSYNRVNGTYVSESGNVLNDILKKEWGFDGLVMSDWGAVNDRVPDLKAGLDLEMPGPSKAREAEIVQAIADGSLTMEELDACVSRILTVVELARQNFTPAEADLEAHHQLARRISAESSVLLKNENAVLPLKKGGSCAFIGAFAKAPRYQGGGSSHINSFKTSNAVAAAEGIAEITYAEGYSLKTEEVDPAMIAAAVEAAKGRDAAVIFAGLPDSFESEGYDRRHMRMPANQNALIAAVAAVNPNTVVVLHNGSPAELPWADAVPAILEMYLGGQAVGESAVDVLFGDVNPSGKLAETVPCQLEDNPSSLNFPGEGDEVNYREGIFVGYRYYDKKKMAVRFPFGHGLSYTSFAYSGLTLSGDFAEGGEVTASVTVTNTGSVSGKEKVQFYIAPPADCRYIRAVRELKGFAAVELAPGESRTVSVTLNDRSFAIWNTEIHDWFIEPGTYTVCAAASSRDLRCEAPLKVTGAKPYPFTCTPNTIVGDVMQYPAVKALLDSSSLGNDLASLGNEGDAEQIMLEMMRNMPLRGLMSWVPGLTKEKIQALVDEINAAQ